MASILKKKYIEIKEIQPAKMASCIFLSQNIAIPKVNLESSLNCYEVQQKATATRGIIYGIMRI